jgi:hypothetical protein
MTKLQPTEQGWQSLLLGAYWPSRQESREACAARMSRFLATIRNVDSSLTVWFPKANRKRLGEAVDISPSSVCELLKSNNRDTTGEPIAELGFRAGLWNGKNASLTATLGAFSHKIENSVLLSYNGEAPCTADVWRQLIQAAIICFEPKSAVVTSPDYMERHGDGTPDETGGWFTYKRGGEVSQYAFP